MSAQQIPAQYTVAAPQYVPQYGATYSVPQPAEYAQAEPVYTQAAPQYYAAEGQGQVQYVQGAQYVTADAGQLGGQVQYIQAAEAQPQYTYLQPQLQPQVIAGDQQIEYAPQQFSSVTYAQPTYSAAPMYATGAISAAPAGSPSAVPTAAPMATYAQPAYSSFAMQPGTYPAAYGVQQTAAQQDKTRRNFRCC